MICTYLIECILLGLTTYTTPLRLELPIFITPANVIVLREPADNMYDFFVTLPSIKIIGDSIFFRNSKTLILRDGVPISSLADVDFPSIERIEVLGEDASSLYGNTTCVINIITKTFSYDTPYSKITLARYPEKKEYEFGRNLGKNCDLYVTGDIESGTISGNIGYKNEPADIRLYFGKKFALTGSLFSHYKFVLTNNYFIVSSTFKFKNHTTLLGIDNYEAVGLFVEDYFRVSPILFIVPSLRYDRELYPKLSFGYIPKINLIAFGSITRHEINFGSRYNENTVVLYKRDGAFGIDATFVSPCIKGAKLTYGLSNKKWSARLTYQSNFRNGNLGLHFLLDSRWMVRVELKVIDVRLWARLENELHPSFGLSWEFWN